MNQEEELKLVRQIVKLKNDMESISGEVFDGGFNEEAALTYIERYSLIRDLLQQNFGTHLLAKSRIDELPILNLEQLQPKQSALTGILYSISLLLFPIWIYFYLRNYMHSQEAKSHILGLNGQVSSIEFLIKDPDHFKK